MVDVPSSFFSSAAGSAPAASPAAGAAPPAAGAAPPPEPTFRSRSLTSLPSRAYSHINSVFCSSVSVYAHLGEQSCPDGLDLLDLCGLDDRLELVGLFKLAIVSAIANCTSGVVQ